MTVPQLPDEMMLEVMQYLDAKDLLTCRLVDKRFCGLALHPHLWRNLWLSVSNPDPFACAVLYLAPRLHFLRVELMSAMNLVCTTKCAVEDLTLDVDGGDGAVLAADVIRNQESAGRLRSVRLIFHKTAIHYEKASKLFNGLAGTCGLKNLVLENKTDHDNFFIDTINVHEIAQTASLTHFRCNLDIEELEPFCLCVMYGHAATLEFVALETNFRQHSPASLLAQMPNLCVLDCYLIPELEELVACRRLSQLDLALPVGCQDLMAGLVELFGGAKQLTSVYLNYLDYSGSYDVGLDLVQALASGPSASSIVDFSITTDSEFDSFPQLQPLLSALPLMPVLESLSVSSPVDELLRFISPTTVPSLFTFHVDDPQDYSVHLRCPHAWVHRDAVLTFLLANPSLHVQIHLAPCGLCEACAQDCHQELLGYDHVGFFSHPEDECHSEDDHPTDAYYCDFCEVDDCYLVWIHVSTLIAFKFDYTFRMFSLI